MNTLVIMLDSLRPDFLGYGGHPEVVTPHIDRIASEGVFFERAYSEYPITIPTRTAMVAGIYTHPCRPWRPLLPDDLHLAELLRDAGIVTGAIGDSPFMRGGNMERGFAEFTPLLHGKVACPADPSIEPDLEGISFPSDTTEQERAFVRWYRQNRKYCQREGRAESTEATVEEVEKFLTTHREKPFFLWVDSFEPHEPWDTPEKFTHTYRWNPEGRFIPMPHYGPNALSPADLENLLFHYMGSITRSDRIVGAIDRILEKLGLKESTCVIIVSDHGEPFGEHGTIRKFGVPIYEELARIVWIVRAPGMKQPGRRSRSLISSVDMLPTILSLHGVEVPKRAEGESLVPLLKGDRDHLRERLFLGAFQVRRGVIEGKWKFIDNLGQKPNELYDLENDPGEEINLAEKESVRAKDLHRAIWEFSLGWSNGPGMRGPRTMSNLFFPEEAEPDYSKAGR